MKLCIDCRWHEEGYCKSPQNTTERVSPVTGKTEKTYRGMGVRMCSSHRTGMLTSWIGCRLHGICGAEGRWFTPKEVQP